MAESLPDRRERELGAEDAERDAALLRLDRDALNDAVTRLRAENEALKVALNRIAKQGGGRWDGERMAMVGFTGEEWVHWEVLAQRALASDDEEATR